MRIRKTDGRYSTTLYRTDTLCNGSQTVVEQESSSFGVYSGSTTKVVDVVTKDFKRRSAAGEIFNNPFDLVKEKYTLLGTSDWEHHYTGTCSGTTLKSRSGNHYSGDVLPWLEPTPSNIGSVLHTIAGTQAWGNVVSPEVLGGENMHDLEQTWRLLRHPLEGFHQLIHKIRGTRSFLRQTKSLGEFMSDTWLKYRYGATPLMHDLMNGFHAAVVPVYSDRHTARGSASAPNQYETATEAIHNSTHPGTCTRSVSANRWCRAGILYQHHFTVGDRWGSSAHNILPTLWEILPYSFVVDWFVNVGDFLAACTPKANVVVLSSWTTHVGEYLYTREHRITHSDYTSPWSGSGEWGFTDQRERKHIARTPGAERGVTFRTNDWTFSKSKNWVHFADGMALAGQYLMRRPRSKPPQRTRSGRYWKSYRPWRGSYDTYERGGEIL
jgi:hypothetical protein